MYFADIYVREPLDKVMADEDFLNERIVAKFLTFRRMGQNIYGVRPARVDAGPEGGDGAAAAGNSPLMLKHRRRHLEMGPRGVVEVGREPFSVHVTMSGTPHHSEHVFGYWHINDKDELGITLPPHGPEEPSYRLLIMGYPTEDETDRIAWYCERCNDLVFLRELRTGRVGFQQFWRFEAQAVGEYNASATARTCPTCGHVNPFGYTAFPKQDQEAERQARSVW